MSATTSRERDVAIAAAVREGRITAGEREVWARHWDRDPAGTHRTLQRLMPVPAVAAAPQEPGADPGDPLGWTAPEPEASDPMFSGAPDAPVQTRTIADADREREQLAAAAPSAGVARSELTGRLVYRGFPAAAGAGGAPHVFVESGWMSVEAFEAAGLGDGDLRDGMAAVQLAPQGPAAAAFGAGPGGA